MKIILFGATGMVGQGVLRECLLDRESPSSASQNMCLRTRTSTVSIEEMRLFEDVFRIHG